MPSSASLSANAAFRPRLSFVMSSVPFSTTRVVPFDTVSASPWMLSTSSSFEYALNTFQPSRTLVFEALRNARKANAADGFEFMDRLHFVAAGGDVIRDDRERELLRRHVDDLEQLRRHEHARRADGLQLSADEHRA